MRRSQPATGLRELEQVEEPAQVGRARPATEQGGERVERRDQIPTDRHPRPATNGRTGPSSATRPTDATRPSSATRPAGGIGEQGDNRVGPIGPGHQLAPDRQRSRWL